MSFLEQKAQEISFVLLRVAIYVRRLELRQRIERLAFQLVENVNSANFEYALRDIGVIEAMLGLGKNLYEVEPVNYRIIARELRSFDSAIRQIAGLDKLPDLESMFSTKKNGNSATNLNISKEVIIAGSEMINPAKEISGNDINSSIIPTNNAVDEEINGNGIAIEIRQSMILDKMRQSGNLRFQMKDIVGILPDVSERTLRYDLQRLCNQGSLQRVGNGGPATYYVIK